jgi:hypothetical protein
VPNTIEPVTLFLAANIKGLKSSPARNENVGRENGNSRRHLAAFHALRISVFTKSG